MTNEEIRKALFKKGIVKHARFLTSTMIREGNWGEIGKVDAKVEHEQYELPAKGGYSNLRNRTVYTVTYQGQEYKSNQLEKAVWAAVGDIIYLQK